MPQPLTYPGVYIEELPSGVRPVIGVATSITAFVGYAPRGPEHRAVRLASFGDYERRFGGVDRESEMSLAVQQFFRNGGSDALVVRVPKDDAESASITLHDATTAPANPALILTAASTGVWGNALAVDVDHAGAPDDRSFTVSITDLTTGAEERFANLTVDPGSTRFAVTRLNDPDRGRARDRQRGDAAAARPVAGRHAGRRRLPAGQRRRGQELHARGPADRPLSVTPSSLPQPQPQVAPVAVVVIGRNGERVADLDRRAARARRAQDQRRARAGRPAAGLGVRVVPAGSGRGLRIVADVDAGVAPSATDAAFTVTGVAAAGPTPTALPCSGWPRRLPNVGPLLRRRHRAPAPRAASRRGGRHDAARRRRR